MTKLNVLSQELLAYGRQIEESLAKGVDVDVIVSLSAKAGGVAMALIDEAHSVGAMLLRDAFPDDGEAA